MSDLADIRPQGRPGGHRARLADWLETPKVRNTIIALIIVNAITLGLSTSDRVVAATGGWLAVFDDVVIAIFVVEMVLKLYAYGIRFFYSAWNWFDLVIVSVSLVPATENLSVLRGLRVIRAMRVLSAVPQMRDVIKALLEAMPGMGAVIVLLGIVFYIFAVMATMLYGDTFPQWFGSVGASLYSLFQIMTLESWSMGIVRPVMEVHPYAWAFFVPFIISTSFAVLNLFIGILVNTMQAAVEEAQDEELSRILQIVQDGQKHSEDRQKEILARLDAMERRNG